MEFVQYLIHNIIAIFVLCIVGSFLIVLVEHISQVEINGKKY